MNVVEPHSIISTCVVLEKLLIDVTAITAVAVNVAVYVAFHVTAIISGVHHPSQV